MLKPIDELLDELEDDPWRRSQMFSSDIVEANQLLFDLNKKPTEHERVVREWVKGEQPCLFGRMAAAEQIQVCVLTERDVYQGESHVRGVIAENRLQWKRKGSSGMQHGFIILLASPRVAHALPSPNLRDLALRLCEIYLSEQESKVDKILLDSLPLQITSGGGSAYRSWRAGVNFFGAQGDQRWWHDHRFPGGVAFSMNSVGHMTRSRLELSLPHHPKLQRITPVDRLVDFALYFAMKTIHKASRGTRPGTRLAPRDALCTLNGGERKAALRDMEEYNERIYLGHYDTDMTIPSEYFDPVVEKPIGTSEKELLFTYLHDRKDSDYALMGLGTEISPEEVFDALGWT